MTDEEIEEFYNKDLLQFGFRLKEYAHGCNVYGYYTDNEEYYNKLTGRTVYKDKDKDNQYVIEYDDSEKNQSIDFDYNYIIYNIDKFTLGDEIKIK